MDPFPLPVLFDLQQAFQPAPGTSPQAIRDLLRAVAAISILEDPANAILPPGDFDPILVEAVRAGADQAARLTLSGTRLRLGDEVLPAGTEAAETAEHRSEIFGPFVDSSGRLLRFFTIESPPFLHVNARLPVVEGPAEGELLLMIPASSSPIPNTPNWSLPAGTVWIESRFLVPGGTSFAGVRVQSGTLEFSRPVLRQGAFLLVIADTDWTLSVELEQPEAGGEGGSDGDAFVLQLPTQLKVHSNAPPELTGEASLSGFGSDLHLSPSGAPFVDGHQLCFALQAAEPVWAIDGNASRAVQFSGNAVPGNPRWAVPVSNTTPEQLGEAAHGGSIVFSAGDSLTSTLAAQEGDVSRWFVATVTVNADQVEIVSLQPASGARYDLAQWSTSLTKLRFAGSPIEKLSFRSARGGFDSVAVLLGGSCTTQWDLPRRADGQPFEFDGVLNSFGFISSPSSFLVSLQAMSIGAKKLVGFALENLYLLVNPPRQLAFNAAFDQAPLLPSGGAVLMFDAIAALPTLPDPYAANLVLRDANLPVEGALRVTMDWSNADSPAIAAHLDPTLSRLPFPEPQVDLPADQDEKDVYGAFQTHLASKPELLYMLDLSSREHLFGVALEQLDSPFNNKPAIEGNRLAVQLNQIRLLMQPQVQWEPVRIEGNPDVLGLVDGFGHSGLDGGPTLVGARSVKLVPVLPGSLSGEIIDAARAGSPAAALFSLPFGLRAMTSLNVRPHGPIEEGNPPETFTVLNEPVFGEFTSARQLRLIAIGGRGFDPNTSVMPGIMRQLSNFIPDRATGLLPSGLTSVLPKNLHESIKQGFSEVVPLHHVDLSGYGLSTFSEWSQDVEVGAGFPGFSGFSKVEFHVLNGRTAYEVIQFRSILYECGARLVRTVILERKNSGRVFRTDTGWVAIDDGEFKRPDAFQKGAVNSFQNIRRIRITGPVITLARGFEVEPVIFDADAAIDGATEALVPIYDRPGYVGINFVLNPALNNPPLIELEKQLLTLLFQKVHAISGPIDCAVRVGGTLQAQISSIVSDLALDDKGGVGFAVAIVGAPKLPRAGQWSFVRLDAFTHEPAAVDAHRGVPLVRNGPSPGPFKFREPADTRRTNAAIEYALLMATDTSRALFKTAKIDPAQPGKLLFDTPPIVADPHSLVQATGPFPRPNFALPLFELPSFTISPDDLWRIDNHTFTVVAKPLSDFMKGSGWGLTRDYDLVPNPDHPNLEKVILGIDSAVPAVFNVASPPSLLNLQLPDPLGQVIQIRSHYEAVAGGLSKLATPDLLFSGALKDLTDTLDSLSHLVGLPFHFDVSITAGSGASPSFVVHMGLLFRVGDGPDGRVEIGVGKFYGQFTVKGELEAALTGVERALLFMEFEGDVQQGIFPPLLYAGGLFRFSVELHENGGPLIQLTLGIVISIGGDLIPGLLSVEGTIKYGYSLVPETLQPGILIGIEARAKLLLGLIGFSFSAEVLARIRRNNPATVTIFAQIRIAASVHIAIFFDEDIDFETQFQQDIPLAALGLLPGVGMAVLAAEVPV